MATTTAAQKKAEEKARYDAFLAVCPSQKLLDRISDKWVTLVLSALSYDGQPEFDATASEGRDRCAIRSCPACWPASARKCSPRRSARWSGTADHPHGDGDRPGHGHLRAHRPRALAAASDAWLKAWAQIHMDDVFANRESYDDANA